MTARWVSPLERSGSTFAGSETKPHVGAPIDANGNLTSDGTRTFEGDARNPLVAVNAGTQQREFTYDGLQQRVRTIEKEGGVVRSDTWAVWCDDSEGFKDIGECTAARTRLFNDLFDRFKQAKSDSDRKRDK